MNVPLIWNEDVGRIEGHLDDQARWKRPDLPPGSASWAKGGDGEIAVLRFVCPCGCSEIGHVPVKDGYGGAHWQWDGDLVAPSLTPSILRISGCKWHGYLTKGVFVSC